jgi:hypothetical protein
MQRGLIKNGQPFTANSIDEAYCIARDHMLGMLTEYHPDEVVRDVSEELEKNADDNFA